MNILSQCFHVGKFLVGEDVSVGVAATFPGVVNIEVLISCVFHAAADHCIGDLPNDSVIHPALEVVPAVPAHGRGSDQTIVGNLVQRRRRNASRHRPFSVWSTASNHLYEWCVRTAAGSK